MENGFLSRLVSEHSRGGATPDLMFTSRKGLLGGVAIRDHVGYSDHEIMEFSIFGETRRGINKTFTLDF